MCLDRLTVKRTLKNDKEVWKMIEIRNKKTNIERACLDSYIFNKHNCHAKIKEIWCSLGFGNERYFSGFHCFTKKEYAKKWGIRYGLYRWERKKILEYIIPKGTTVQYGKQEGFSVIVTPILINPRIK